MEDGNLKEYIMATPYLIPCIVTGIVIIVVGLIHYFDKEL
jgi:hypothetical protein